MLAFWYAAGKFFFIAYVGIYIDFYNHAPIRNMGIWASERFTIYVNLVQANSSVKVVANCQNSIGGWLL